MLKIKINKLLKNNLSFVMLILIVFMSILTTNFYSINKENQKEIILWGDGTQKRELVFVEDFVNIMIILLDKLENEVVNIGAGKEYNIKEFAQIVCNIIGINHENIKYDTSRYTGAKSKILDNSKLKKLIQNYSQIPIEDGLKLTIDWIMHNSN